MPLATWILWAGLVGYAEGGAIPDAVRRDYEAARLTAGRDADSQVKLALWCERHGLNVERRRHLALAVMADPKNPTARGLLGQVADGEKWSTVAQPGQPPKAGPDSATREEYRRRRDAMKGSADAHLKLAKWCDEAGLKEEAVAHYCATIRRDQSKDEAWRRLGYKSRKGRWVTDAQLTAERAQAAAQQKADKHWRPKLAGIRSRLEGRERAAREAAVVEVAGVSDPLAVPSIWDVFANNGASGQRTAAQLFGQIDSPFASRSLALLALYAEKPETRRVALETLRHREARDYLSIFVDLVAEPVTYRVQAVSGPGSPGVLAIEGKKSTVRRIYAPPAMPDFRILDGEVVTYDNEGLPVIDRITGFDFETFQTPYTQPPSNANSVSGPNGILASFGTKGSSKGGPGQSTPNSNQFANLSNLTTGFEKIPQAELRAAVESGWRPDSRGSVRLEERTSVQRPVGIHIPIGQIAREYQRMAILAQEQLAGDARSVDESNARVRFSNDRVLGALKVLTGQELGADREAWSRWWAREQGYAFALTSGTPESSVLEQIVPLNYASSSVGPTPFIGPASNVFSELRLSHSCFAKGTPVRTLDGLRPIETIRIGDRVLVQNPENGSLQVKPIVQVFHNPPAPTLSIALGDESVVATPIHRFWVAGRGWVQAERLKVGDRVRTLSGLAEVKSVEEAGVRPVFNLEVASGESYFVGTSGALVHDNSTIRPTPRPFDAVAEAGPVASR